MSFCLPATAGCLQFSAYCGIIIATRHEGSAIMETKDVIYELRTRMGLSQEELAEKLYVTRQAVSRWEVGETIPNTETLKLLSRLFDVSINTLLGSPQRLICQCCGMPLDDGSISREKDGSLNEEYCRWCYADGKFCYSSLEELTDFLVTHMSNDGWSEDEARAYFEKQLPTLNYWKRYEELSDGGEFEQFKQQLIRELNDLHVDGMPEVKTLNYLIGGYINMEYTLPSGEKVKFLDDSATYLGTQLECAFGGGRCFGVAASMDFLLVCTYGADGRDPELVIYKKR